MPFVLLPKRRRRRSRRRRRRRRKRRRRKRSRTGEERKTRIKEERGVAGYLYICSKTNRPRSDLKKEAELGWIS